jgi:uncharacterized membrane protein YqiK
MHRYDERLAPITVRSKDGFAFSLDVSQIIHIGMKNAPRVISRVGSMQNLVDHVLQPTVGNYFRNSAQEVTVLDFLWARSQRQREAFQNVRVAIEAYDVECIDTLIGDIAPPADLMKTQTDRKIAAELQRTYDAQREAEMQRQTLERETAIANLQKEVVRSEQMVRISQQNALATAETAKGEANATRIRAEGAAAAVRMSGEGEAASVRAVGAAKAEAYRQGIDAVGAGGYTAMQLASILGENKVKLVPDIAVTGDGSGGLVNAMLARLNGESCGPPRHRAAGDQESCGSHEAGHRNSPARERRQRGLGHRHAVERVAPWMRLPEVAAQKRRSVHAIVRRVADEHVLPLKHWRRHHLENHLAAARAEDLVRASAAQKRLP